MAGVDRIDIVSALETDYGTHRENIAIMSDRRRRREYYVHNIESDFREWYIGPPGVVERGIHQFPALLVVDCAIGWTEIFRSPAFHFYKDERVAIPRDQVGLSRAGASAMVPRNYCHSSALQEAVGKVFTPASRRQIRIPGAAAPMVSGQIREPVKRSEHLAPPSDLAEVALAIQPLVYFNALSFHSITLPRTR